MQPDTSAIPFSPANTAARRPRWTCTSARGATASSRSAATATTSRSSACTAGCGSTRRTSSSASARSAASSIRTTSTTRTPTERLASLERSSYLNDAFRTLRDPVARLEYLLKLEGFAPKEARESSSQVPPGLLEEVFELNEELEAIQDLRAEGATAEAVAARLEAARQPDRGEPRDGTSAQLAALMAAHDARFNDGDAAGRRATLEAMRTLLLERTYLTNLLATVRREMGGGEAAHS